METAKKQPEDPDRVRERILRAARDEFATNGYVAASVRPIAERAGVTAAMINYYFGTKEALYDMVVAEAQGRLLEALSAAAAAGGAEGLPERLAVAYFDFLSAERQLQRLLLRQMLDRPDQVRAHAEVVVGPLRALLDTHFGDRAVADEYAVSVFGAISAWFIYEPVLGAFLGRDPRTPKNLAARRRHVAELVSLIEGSTP